MYITYNTITRKILRIDDNLIDLGEENLKIIERDITFDDDICLNMPTYKVDKDEQFYVDEELVVEQQINTLRVKREPLLKAFDIYKSNLIVGAIVLSDEEQQEIIDWYNLILDLDEDAINNPPQAISRYL